MIQQNQVNLILEIGSCFSIQKSMYSEYHQDGGIGDFSLFPPTKINNQLSMNTNSSGRVKESTKQTSATLWNKNLRITAQKVQEKELHFACITL